MNDPKSILSRLLAGQPMQDSNYPMTPPPQTIGATLDPNAAAAVEPASVAQVAQVAPQMSDAEARQKQIADREAARQQAARDKLANRQSGVDPGPQPRNESPMESDAGYEEPSYEDNYGIEDLVSGAKERSEGRLGELDRRPISEWSKKDWGSFLVDVGGGFANAKDGQFSSGLAGATKGATNHLSDLDDRAEKHDDRMKDRMDALDDMLMEDGIRRRRTMDDRAYSGMLRNEEREYRSGEKQDERLYDTQQDERRRGQAIEDRDESRSYNAGVRKEERDYAEKAAIAANARADSKELRAAAAKNSRDYSSDYVKMATELNKGRLENSETPLTSEELDAIIIPQLKRAYGIGGTLGGPSTQNVLPGNRTLSSGY